MTPPYGSLELAAVSDRPVIGICAVVDRARYGAWDIDAVLIAKSYVDAVQRAGGVALVLPPDPAVTDAPDGVLDLLDGLLLAGGVDLVPASYDASPLPTTVRGDPARDAFEIALTTRALERDLPFLGICRGMQILNVARGGTLRQDLPQELGHDHHRRRLGSFEGSDHEVRLAEESLAARAAGETLHNTKSHHHQGVDEIGEGLVITGWATMDELPEAIEAPDLRYALGVQWHPEADETSNLVTSLVQEARVWRAEHRGTPAA